MVYKARQNANDWDLLDPNGNAVTLGLAYPCDDDDETALSDMWSHATTNGFVGDALATVNSGFERV